MRDLVIIKSMVLNVDSIGIWSMDTGYRYMDSSLCVCESNVADFPLIYLEKIRVLGAFLQKVI